MMHIDKYKYQDKETDSEWFKYQGADYENAECLLQTGILGLCGCGDNESNLVYIAKALEYLQYRLESYSDSAETYQNAIKKELEFFKSKEAARLMYYFLDSKGLTEHGSSIPGWLSEKGKEFMEDVFELYGVNDV
jgi:hypothetical protein